MEWLPPSWRRWKPNLEERETEAERKAEGEEEARMGLETEMGRRRERERGGMGRMRGKFRGWR